MKEQVGISKPKKEHKQDWVGTRPVKSQLSIDSMVSKKMNMKFLLEFLTY